MESKKHNQKLKRTKYAVIFFAKDTQKNCHQGDPKYKEYEESLVGITREKLEMSHVGHIGYGLLNALGPEALAYYLAGLH